MSESGSTEGSGFRRELGLLDSTMIVAGSMIGSGIFIVSADIARQVGAPGWLLVVWLVTGVLTLVAAVSYGELAAMMPRAGGQYVYLREAFSPLWGFLYGWTLFLVIQTGTIAAVGIGFAKYLGELWPKVSEEAYLIPPLRVLPGYAISLSTAQLVGILMIAFLTWINTRGLRIGKLIQNVFTLTKTGALCVLAAIGIGIARNSTAVAANFSHFWVVRGDLQDVGGGLTAATALGLFVAICVAQTNSLFSAEAWNNITFTAGEVKNPKRNLPLSLTLGTILVIGLYLLANVAYLSSLPLEGKPAELAANPQTSDPLVRGFQHAASDRVATATADIIFPGYGALLMALAIIISTFGCANGLILTGARAYYAMARDGLFFGTAGKLSGRRVPAGGLVIQGIWAAVLVLPRTISADSPAGQMKLGNLYNDLLTYIVSGALLFYILTIAGIFVLRVKRPDVPRPYRAFGYPVVPALYIAGASVILMVLFVYQAPTAWPGLGIVATGVPVYFLWHGRPAGPGS